MNYRHQFHAGNFADVMKHTLLIQLFRGLQRKEKGFLYLDTHAGRGRYDLAAAARGDSLARRPEHPNGIGRLADAATLIEPLAEYVAVVRAFAAEAGAPAARPREIAADANPAGPAAASEEALRFYPGSPWIAFAVARAQDRLAFCEKQLDEADALRAEFAGQRRVSVHAMDGYAAIRAMLPAPEKRALVLIDPPFEAQDEFAQIVAALGEGLRRAPAATFAVWYPLTERAQVEEFFDQLDAVRLPPTFAAELAIAGDAAPQKLKGCGLVVVNPPWQLDREIAPVLDVLAAKLAQAPGSGAGRVRWIVAE